MKEKLSIKEKLRINYQLRNALHEDSNDCKNYLPSLWAVSVLLANAYSLVRLQRERVILKQKKA